MDTKDAMYCDTAGNFVKPPVSEEETKDVMKGLPMPPRPIREWTETETATRYGGDKENMSERLLHKLYSVWAMWSALYDCEELRGLLKQASEPESVEYRLKYTIVDILDILGKRLSDTNVAEELFWLLNGLKRMDDSEKNGQQENGDGENRVGGDCKGGGTRE